MLQLQFTRRKRSTLVDNQKREVVQTMTEELVRQPEINMNDLKQLVVSTKSAQPTDAEMYVFKRLCESLNANPFLKDIHLVKYSKDSPASFITGKDFFTKVARSQGATWNAGTIVLRNNKVTKEIGSFTIQGDVLVGGWAEVQTKDGTFSHQVSFDEYNNNQSTWKKMPHTMIRKVALVQTLREVFPDRFAGVYDSAEMQQAVEGLDIVAATDPDMPTPEPEIIEVPDDEPDTFTAASRGRGGSIKADPNSKYYCKEHDTDWFKRGKMRGYAHPIGETGQWCNMPEEPEVIEQVPDDEPIFSDDDFIINENMLQKDLEKACKSQGWSSFDLNDALGKNYQDYLQDNTPYMAWSAICSVNGKPNLV